MARPRSVAMLILALPATLALVPGHPYGRSLRPRAAADVRWPGVVAMAEGDGGKVPTKRADELLQALQDAEMRGVQPKEEEEPNFFSAEGLKKEFALLKKGEGVRAAPSNLKRSSAAASHSRAPTPCAGDVRVHRGVRADLRLLPRHPAAHRRAALHPLPLHVPLVRDQ